MINKKENLVSSHKNRKNNFNLHTYTMGEFHRYLTQLKVKNKVIFKEEIDIEIKVFKKLSSFQICRVLSKGT